MSANLGGSVSDRSGPRDILDEKKWQVLSATVSGYIRSALPVGSQSVNRTFGLPYSPATIRNIMSVLEEMGYLTHPHTSAGRVPTEKGFRYFVDHSDFDKKEFEEWADLSEGIEPLLSESCLTDFSEVLSKVVAQVGRTSGYAVFLMETGTLGDVRVVGVEAVPLSGRQALLVVILETGHLLKRTFVYPEGIGWLEFRKIVGKLNRVGRYRTLSEIRDALLSEMEGISMAWEAIVREFECLGGIPDVKLFGASRFAKDPEFSRAGDLESVFHAFEEQVALFGFLRKLVEARGISVSIGSENELPGLGVCTLVSIPLIRSGSWFGTIGVVGPVRMDYEQVIPLMSRLSGRLNHWLGGLEGEV